MYASDHSLDVRARDRLEADDEILQFAAPNQMTGMRYVKCRLCAIGVIEVGERWSFVEKFDCFLL